MHIPDGFLDAKTALATGLLAAAGLGLALHHARRTLPPRKVPLLGLSAAFVFAAQMLNFPVVGGTSGITVDNSALNGGSQAYFSFGASATSGVKCPAPSGATSGGCAVQASQLGLN